jgi:hypothetical protein
MSHQDDWDKAEQSTKITYFIDLCSEELQNNLLWSSRIDLIPWRLSDSKRSPIDNWSCWEDRQESKKTDRFTCLGPTIWCSILLIKCKRLILRKVPSHVLSWWYFCGFLHLFAIFSGCILICRANKFHRSGCVGWCSRFCFVRTPTFYHISGAQRSCMGPTRRSPSFIFIFFLAPESASHTTGALFPGFPDALLPALAFGRSFTFNDHYPSDNVSCKRLIFRKKSESRSFLVSKSQTVRRLLSVGLAPIGKCSHRLLLSFHLTTCGGPLWRIHVPLRTFDRLEVSLWSSWWSLWTISCFQDSKICMNDIYITILSAQH